MKFRKKPVVIDTETKTIQEIHQMVKDGIIKSMEIK